MRLTDRARRRKESTILETLADKIIFWTALAVYTVVLLIESRGDPRGNTISSSLAVFGISAFLISKAIHIHRTRPPRLPKEKAKFWAMPVISLLLTAFGVWMLLSKYVFK